MQRKSKQTAYITSNQSCTHKLQEHNLLSTTGSTMTSEKNAQVGQAREAFQMMYQISQLLNTGLDADTLSTCIRLCELGVDPEVLAHVIKEIRKMGDNAAQSKPVNLHP